MIGEKNKLKKRVIGRMYKVIDNSWTTNISNFKDKVKPTITCACPASNENSDIVEIVAGPFEMKPIWILKEKTPTQIVIVKNHDGEFYSTYYSEHGLVRKPRKRKTILTP